MEITIPDSVISKAKTYLKELETAGAAPKQAEPPEPEKNQVSLCDFGADEAVERLRSLDVDSLRPIDALNLLSELCELVGG